MIKDCLNKTLIISALTVLPLFLVTPAFAAAPDGAGPWADTVVTTAQGLQKNGSAVLPVRSDPTSALGVAEQTNAEGTFYSLGFGGSITLGFVNGIQGGSMIFESTNMPYPIETAKVEFSSNGTTWVNAGSVSQTGTVKQPQGVSCAKFVRITDTSDKSLFEPTADGYDVDGVKALGDPCTPPTGGGCNCGCSNISQSNNSNITNTVTTNSNTGGNNSNGNTGGSTSITTGGTTTDVSVSVGGSTNTASNNCCNGDSQGGGNNVTISNNGAGSTNIVTITNGKKHKITKK